MCPSRARTPFGLARRGKMWPGRWKSAAVDFPLERRRIVMERSVADIPVEIPVMMKAKIFKLYSQILQDY